MVEEEEQEESPTQPAVRVLVILITILATHWFDPSAMDTPLELKWQSEACSVQA
jgi:hypothetical protein